MSFRGGTRTQSATSRRATPGQGQGLLQSAVWSLEARERLGVRARLQCDRGEWCQVCVLESAMVHSASLGVPDREKREQRLEKSVSLTERAGHDRFTITYHGDANTDHIIQDRT